jgi:hypothetical protein
MFGVVPNGVWSGVSWCLEWYQMMFEVVPNVTKGF